MFSVQRSTLNIERGLMAMKAVETGAAECRRNLESIVALVKLVSGGCNE